jgi:uncharacterized protein (TIRG00374 family)
VAIVLNLFGWAVDLLINWSYGNAFHLSVPFSAYLSLTVVLALLTTFPITFGNVGTWELAILGVLELYGVSSERALAFAVGTHVVSTLFNVCLGCIAMFAMRLRPSEVFSIRGKSARRSVANASGHPK